jgi:hypothetical protein
VFPSAATITATATPLLDDPPGQVRMIAFWGEPGAHEPGVDTPVTFLGVDGRWRRLTVRDLGGDASYLSAGQHTLSPDGSRWVVASRGWNQMVDFRTGELVKLSRASHTYSARWSPDSKTVALWSITSPGLEVFDRTGHRVASLSIDVKKRSMFVDNGGRVTIFEPLAPGAEPSLNFTTYDLDGAPVVSKFCALPAGYPPRLTGVDGYDGRHLLIGALVDRRHGVYRYTMIDTESGTVVDDIRYAGWVPYVDERVEPGAYMAGITGGPDGIYGVDPSTGDMTRLSQIGVYRNQAGYENHAHDQFARDLIFNSKDAAGHQD